MNGRLRIWCWHCEAGADTALKRDQIPFWPYGTPQQRRSCVSVTLSSQARPLLLRAQTDILAILAGDRPRGPWSRSLPRARVIDVLCRLVFVMLGPLWEGTHQAAPAQIATDGRWLLSDTWTPGSLPPRVAAPALLAAITFLAAESGTRLAGITWNRQLLAFGEDDAITAETLLWHLDGFNAGLVQDLFKAPFMRPFAMLLTPSAGIPPAMPAEPWPAPPCAPIATVWGPRVRQPAARSGLASEHAREVARCAGNERVSTAA
jgi:hypothetical protein